MTTNIPKPSGNLFHKPQAAPVTTVQAKPKKPYVRREHLTQRPFKELAQVKFWANPNKKES